MRFRKLLAAILAAVQVAGLGTVTTAFAAETDAAEWEPEILQRQEDELSRDDFQITDEDRLFPEDRTKSQRNRYVINDVEIYYDDFASGQNGCWDYANKFYNKIWHQGYINPYFDDASNILRDKSDTQLTLTEAHLREYVAMAPCGSIIRLSNAEYLHAADNWGHSQLIVSKNSNGFTVFEGGVSNLPPNYCQECTYTYSDYVNQYIVNHAYIKYIKCPQSALGPVETGAVFSPNSLQSITADNAILARTLTVTGTSLANVTRVGIKIYDSNGSLIKSYDEAPAVDTRYNYMGIYYDLKNELGMTLTPGATYRYQFWATILGSVYSSDMDSFTMPGVQNPGKTTITGLVVADSTVTVFWNAVENAAGYDVYLVQQPWGWADIKYSGLGQTGTSCTFYNIASGFYACFIIARPNTDYIQSDWEYFRVAPVTGVAVEPAALTLEVGETRDLTAVVSPDDAVDKSVTWSSDAAHIASVSSDGTVTAVAPGTAAITVTTNSGGKTASCVVTVLANDPLAVTNPSDRTVSAGTRVSFAVTASGGTEPYSYQWQYRTAPNGRWVNVAAASGKTDTYTMTAQARHNGYQYQCVVTDNAGQTVTSDIATLTVGTPPAPLTIAAHPEDRTVTPGSTASFSVTAEGGKSPYTYRWQYRATPNGSWVNVSAASGKTAVYTLTAQARHNGYQYRCVVTDNAGQTVTSDIATLTVGTPPEPLTVSAQPADQTVAAGTKVSFSVTVTGGTAPYRYQWQYRKTETGAWTNVAAASGKTNTYTLTAEARHNGFQYQCLITDAAGHTVLSGIATLTVGSGMAVANEPADVTVAVGETAVFRVSVSGGAAPYTYQWQYLKPGSTSWINVGAASGKTAEYSLKAEARHNGYQYRCAVTDSAGSTVMTKTVLLTVGVNAELAIVSQPAMQTVSVGDTARFSVAVTGGTAPYTYQWQYLKPDATAWANVAAASGKTAEYTLTAEARHNGYVYRCRITDAAGASVTSRNAVLVVGDGQNKIAALIERIPDYGFDFPVLDLTAEEEALWDLGELNEADLPVLPMESSFIGFAGIEEASEACELTADFNDESAAFWGDLSVYDFDEAVDGYDAE